MKYLVRGASHVGAVREAWIIELSDISCVCPIGTLGCEGLSLRLWRHKKSYSTAEAGVVAIDQKSLTSTVDTIVATWESALSVPCTLYSKGGKRLPKHFSISLLVRRGERLREAARGKLNLVALAEGDKPSRLSTLHLEPRGVTRGGAPFHVRWHVAVVASDAKGAATADEEDESSEACSRASSASTLASGTVKSSASRLKLFSLRSPASRALPDQDLEGFETHLAAERVRSSRLVRTPRRPALEPIDSVRRMIRRLVSSKEADGGMGAPADATIDGEADDGGPGERASAQPLVRAGWLRKRSVSAPTMLKNWRPRYVVVSPARRAVLWYKTREAFLACPAAPQGDDTSRRGVA